MIYDIITYNNEKELFDLRWNVLKDVVDKFIVCEAPMTFSGKAKPLYFEEIRAQYSEVWYHVIDPLDAEINYGPLADTSPNVPIEGPKHWRREFYLKEAIRDSLTHLADDDTVFIGDCDEIWNPSLAQHEPKKSHKLGLLVYSYYLNNRSSEQFYGTIWTKYKFIKDKVLNHVRSQPNYFEYVPKGGWHFTSMGGYERVKEKLTDSYTNDSYANDWVLNNLEHNIKESKDFLGRDFTYKIDESEWPRWLQENKEKYKHLCK